MNTQNSNASFSNLTRPLIEEEVINSLEEDWHVTEASENPNVLVALTDQQRWDTVGAYGSPMDLTP